jgi:hypothetical protein
MACQLRPAESGCGQRQDRPASLSRRRVALLFAHGAEETGPPPSPATGRLRAMLTDEEVAIIRCKLAECWRGPVLLKWLGELLADRDELMARLRELETGTGTQQRHE